VAIGYLRKFVMLSAAKHPCGIAHEMKLLRQKSALPDPIRFLVASQRCFASLNMTLSVYPIRFERYDRSDE